MSNLIAVYTEIEQLVSRKENGQQIDETRLAALRKSIAGTEDKMKRAFTASDDKKNHATAGARNELGTDRTSCR